MVLKKNKVIASGFFYFVCAITMHQLYSHDNQEGSWLGSMTSKISTGISNNSDNIQIMAIGASVHYLIATIVHQAILAPIIKKEIHEARKKGHQAFGDDLFGAAPTLRRTRGINHLGSAIAHVITLPILEIFVSGLVKKNHLMRNKWYTVGAFAAWLYGMSSNFKEVSMRTEGKAQSLLEYMAPIAQRETLYTASNAQQDFENAAFENSFATIKNLLETKKNEIDINGQKFRTFSPLMFAVAHQNPQMTKHLLQQKKINIHLKEKHSQLTAMDLAFHDGYEQNAISKDIAESFLQ